VCASSDFRMLYKFIIIILLLALHPRAYSAESLLALAALTSLAYGTQSVVRVAR